MLLQKLFCLCETIFVKESEKNVDPITEKFAKSALKLKKKKKKYLENKQGVCNIIIKWQLLGEENVNYYTFFCIL